MRDVVRVLANETESVGYGRFPPVFSPSFFSPVVLWLRTTVCGIELGWLFLREMDISCLWGIGILVCVCLIGCVLCVYLKCVFLSFTENNISLTFEGSVFDRSVNCCNGILFCICVLICRCIYKPADWTLVNEKLTTNML